MRSAAFRVVTLLAALSCGCKARTPAVSAVKEGEEGGATTDVAAKSAVAEVARACQGASATAFRGVGDGTYVEFSNEKTVAPTGESGQKPWYEEATFDGKVWALSQPVRAIPQGPECLLATTVMTTAQLVAALGCTEEDPCGNTDGICSGPSCPMLAKVDFLSDGSPDFNERVPGETETQIALTGTGAPARCDGNQLTTAGGTAIGKPLETPDQCNRLLATAANGLVCAWTGQSFLPARSSDGQLIGDPLGGASRPSTCQGFIAMATHGAVCSWSGSGLAPFAVENPKNAIGSPNQYGDALHCISKTVAVAGGRICAWDGSAIRLYEVATRKPVPGLAGFPDYGACFATAARVASPEALQRELAAAGAKTAPSGDSRKGQDAPEAGLSLAETGTWTWGDCNDSARAFHLVARSGGTLVCQGKIDTLYSWGPEAKINSLARQSWSGRIRRGGDDKEIFLTQSAFATHGYGPYAIRFRLKSGTKFRFFDGTAAYQICDAMSSSEVEDTVAVRYWNIGQYTGLDFLLCGLGPVHSWSYGTQGHLDEMNREVTWMAQYNYKFYELYVKQNGVDTTYPNGLDGHAFSQQTWTNVGAWHRQKLPGVVHYNPDVTDQTPEAHFSTAWPTYINPGNGASLASAPATGTASAADKKDQPRTYELHFATRNQTDRAVTESQMKIITMTMQGQSMAITCTDEKVGGWALLKLCRVQNEQAGAVLQKIFELLDNHTTFKLRSYG